MAAFPVFCNRARIGHNRRSWNGCGLLGYMPTRPLARLAVSGYSRCAAAEPVNAARIAAAYGGWAFRPRDMPASWARRCAHNASGPVDFLPKKIAAVCERGSPPSCKHPISLTPIGGGGVFQRGEKNLARRMARGMGESKPVFSTPGCRVRLSDPRRCVFALRPYALAPKPPRRIAQCNPVFLR